jgi:DNA mismatch repair ATPase MutS
MSGKSTLMRATAAAALLTICGLSAPVGQNTWVRRFDHIFLRGASSDVPSENKSAFGAEMADIASMIRYVVMDF